MDIEECNSLFDYKYRAENILSSDFMQNSVDYTNIYICSYDVNIDGCSPFMRFLLKKNHSNNHLVFPSLPLLFNLDTNQVITSAKLTLFGLLQHPSDYKIFEDLTVFNGFYEYNNDLYLFFDITKLSIRIEDAEMKNNLWLALIDEIVNHKMVCDISIDYSVIYFFLLNEAFCFLVDANDANVEVPVVCYVRKPTNQLNFTFMFGEPKCNISSLLGPFYYFTDFNASFNGDGNEDSDSECGIVRFAVFLGKTKFIENNINDPPDESEIKQQRLQDESLDQNMERLTMRITDHDGNWANVYDSAYLGNIELDNGTVMNTTLIVVKDYKQQVPISYHYTKYENKTNTNLYSNT